MYFKCEAILAPFWCRFAVWGAPGVDQGASGAPGVTWRLPRGAPGVILGVPGHAPR